MKVLMEFYKVDSTKAVVRKTKLNSLYEEAERKLDEAYVKKMQEKDTHIQKIQGDLEDTKENVLQKDDEIKKLQKDLDYSKEESSQKLNEKECEIMKLRSDLEEANKKECKIKQLQEDLEESKGSVLKKLVELDIVGAFEGNIFTFKKVRGK